MADPRRSRDGRLHVDPPCEFGHTWQAMECPSCAERLTDEKPSPEWWTWYRRRYGVERFEAKHAPREMVRRETGNWVRRSDYEELEADNRRLTAEKDILLGQRDEAERRQNKAEAERDQAREQVLGEVAKRLESYEVRRLEP